MRGGNSKTNCERRGTRPGRNEPKGANRRRRCNGRSTPCVRGSGTRSASGHTGWARSPPRGHRRRGNFARRKPPRGRTRLPNPPPSPSPSPRARRARRRSPRRWRRSALLSTCTSGSGGRRWSARSDSRRRRTELATWPSLSFARCRNPPERKPARGRARGTPPPPPRAARCNSRTTSPSCAPSPTRSRIRCAISSPRRRRLATRWKVRSGSCRRARVRTRRTATRRTPRASRRCARTRTLSPRTSRARGPTRRRRSYYSAKRKTRFAPRLPTPSKPRGAANRPWRRRCRP